MALTNIGTNLAEHLRLATPLKIMLDLLEGYGLYFNFHAFAVLTPF